MARDWAVAKLISHTCAVLASGVHAPADYGEVSTALAGATQALWKRYLVSFHWVPGLCYPCFFHYWASQSLPFPESRELAISEWCSSCPEWIRMSVFCNSASKITHVSLWVLKMAINSAVKLKGSKIAPVFLWDPSFTPARCFTWSFILYNASKLNCEYKIPSAKMEICFWQGLLGKYEAKIQNLCLRKTGCYKWINCFLNCLKKKSTLWFTNTFHCRADLVCLGFSISLLKVNFWFI